MKKIYITKYSKLKLILERGGLKAEIEFKNGRIGDNVPAKFITSDKFLQYLIENDPRYGQLFRLDKSIPEPGDEVRTPAANEIETHKKKVKKDATIVETVRDLSDAIDYFSTLGKVLSTEKQVKATMKEMNIQFPNWE